MRGRRRIVVTFSPNLTLRRLPAARTLRVTGLRRGVHHLTVTVSFRRAGRHGRALLARLRAAFRVC